MVVLADPVLVAVALGLLSELALVPEPGRSARVPGRGRVARGARRAGLGMPERRRLEGLAAPGEPPYS